MRRWHEWPGTMISLIVGAMIVGAAIAFDPAGRPGSGLTIKFIWIGVCLAFLVPLLFIHLATARRCGPGRWALGALAATVLWVMLASWWKLHAVLQVPQVHVVLGFAIAYLAVAVVPGAGSRVHQAMLLAGTVTAATVILQEYGVSLPQLRQVVLGPGGTFPHRNTAAYYVAFALPVAVHQVMVLRGKRTRWIAASVLPILVAGLIFTRSRGAWAAVILSFFTLVVLSGHRLRRSGIAVGCVFALTIGIVAAGIAWRPAPSTAAMLRTHAQREHSNNLSERANVIAEHGSLTARMEYWSLAWRLLPKSPWFGAGPGRFPIVAQLESHKALRGFTDAHNEFVNLTASTGIPAGISWLLFVAAVLVSGFRDAHRDSPPGAVVGLAVAAVALTMCCVESPSQWILLAVIAAPALASVTRTESPTPLQPVWLCCALVIAIAGVTAWMASSVATISFFAPRILFP